MWPWGESNHGGGMLVSRALQDHFELVLEIWVFCEVQLQCPCPKKKNNLKTFPITIGKMKCYNDEKIIQMIKNVEALDPCE